jgi:hypothetical protein
MQAQAVNIAQLESRDIEGRLPKRLRRDLRVADDRATWVRRTLYDRYLLAEVGGLGSPFLAGRA